MDLLDIKIDQHIIKSKFYFWDPYYQRFTFGTIGLTPTIKEYFELLWPNAESLTRVYTPDLDSEPHKHLATLLNVRVAKVKEIS